MNSPVVSKSSLRSSSVCLALRSAAKLLIVLMVCPYVKLSCFYSPKNNVCVLPRAYIKPSEPIIMVIVLMVLSQFLRQFCLVSLFL